MAIATARTGRSHAEAWPTWALRIRQFGLDFGAVLAVLGIYFLLRGAAPDRIGAAVETTAWLIRIEQALGIYIEPGVQELSIQSYWTREFANFVYAYLHFPVLALVGAWLWWQGRERFLFMRNVMFVSMAIGVVFYYALPAAPPRLMELHGYDLGFVDTVFGTETHVSYAQPSLILNEYAALPSFHFGWIVLASVAMWANTRRRLVRTAAVLLTVVMSWAIVASANHLIVDMALGGIVIWSSWVAARWWQMRANLVAVAPGQRWGSSADTLATDRPQKDFAATGADAV